MGKINELISRRRQTFNFKIKAEVDSDKYVTETILERKSERKKIHKTGNGKQ